MDKYIMATIKLPLKVNNDGSFITMNDNIEISFGDMEGSILGEKEVSDENTSLQLKELIEKIILPNELPMSIFKNEIHKKNYGSGSNHLSFKNQKKSSIFKKKDPTRFTVKAR
jgi:hypothetical protein